MSLHRASDSPLSHSCATTDAALSTQPFSQEGVRQDSSPPRTTSPSRTSSDEAAKLQHKTCRTPVPSSDIAHDTSIPSTLATHLPSDEVVGQQLRVANMNEGRIGAGTRSTANTLDDHLPPPSLLPGSHPSPECTGAIHKSHTNNRGEFSVMINHKPVIVPAQYPCFDPHSLFFPYDAKANSKDDCEATDAGGVSDRAGASGIAPYPFNVYGRRPVLLLDCTGALQLRRQRRQRRRELQLRASKLVAARADILRLRKLWAMRRVRARRQQKKLSIPEVPEVGAGNTGDTCELSSNAAASSSSPEGSVSEEDFFSELSHRRKVITREIRELRQHLIDLLQEKRRQSATREGCVLMLPSPDTGKVQLFPGHHYRTVCFVGEDLLEIFPGDTRGTDPGTPRDPQHPPLTPPPVLERPESAHELSEKDAGCAEGKHTSTQGTRRPSWATLELLGYVVYLSQCHSNEDRNPRSGKEVPVPSTPAGDERYEGNLDVEKIAATINCDKVDQYLSLPACEIAMYREWAVDKFNLLSSE